MKKAAILIFLAMSAKCIAQGPDSIPPGIHQVESDFYSAIYGNGIPAGEISSETPCLLKGKKISGLTRMVYGWHPYWAASNAYLGYDYEALTHIAWFSMEVDTATGGYTTLRGWNTTPLIDYAHQRGVKVTLTVTNFGSARNTEILTDTVKQWVLINSVIAQLSSRNGDGVNFDFENVPSSQKANMVSFCRRASRGIKSALPSAEISLATPAVNWSSGWDLKALSEVCDYLIIMGYNYYWGTSSTAGPVAPLTGENYNVTRSVEQDYLAAGVAREKLLLGVPWYGYDWPVTSSARKAATTGSGTSRTYSNAEGVAENHGKVFDQTTRVPWISYLNGSQWRQVWYDDSLSLSMKNDLINSHDLAGLGIWALSYEAGRGELWKGIKAAFLPAVPESGRIIGVTPNPVVYESSISFSVATQASIRLCLIRPDGRLVRIFREGITEPGFYTEKITPDGLTPGIYMVVLYTGSNRSSVKVLILKDE